jgi:hypothetical protein
MEEGVRAEKEQQHTGKSIRISHSLRNANIEPHSCASMPSDPERTSAHVPRDRSKTDHLVATFYFNQDRV